MKFRKGQGKLDRTSTLRGGHWERRGGVSFFQGGCTFHIKNKLKFEIFNDTKRLKAKVLFSVITKNSNWETA